MAIKLYADRGYTIRKAEFCEFAHEIAERLALADENGTRSINEGDVIHLRAAGYFWTYTVETSVVKKDYRYISGNLLRNTVSTGYLHLNESVRMNSCVDIRTEAGRTKIGICNPFRQEWSNRKCPVCATAFIIRDASSGRIKVYNKAEYFTGAKMAAHRADECHRAHLAVYVTMLYAAVADGARVKLVPDVLVYITDFL